MKTWKVGRKRITLSHNNTVLTIYYSKDNIYYKGVYHYNYYEDGLHIGHLVYDRNGQTHGIMKKVKESVYLWDYLKSSAIKLDHKRYPTYAFNPDMPKDILEIL